MQNACQILLNAEQLNKSPGLRKERSPSLRVTPLTRSMSLIKGWGADGVGWLEVKSTRLGCPVTVRAPGWPRAGSGSHPRSAVFTALNKGIVKPASGFSSPSFLRKV